MIWWALLGWLVVSVGLALVIGTAVRLRDVLARRSVPEALEATGSRPVLSENRPPAAAA